MEVRLAFEFCWGAEFELCSVCRHILHTTAPPVAGHLHSANVS